MENNMVLLPQQPITPLQGKSNEWYTPAYIIEAVRRVLGTIDLDPASCEQANQVVRASRFYTAQENGLSLPWYGNVWLNPPYSAEELINPIRFWISKLIQSYEQGEVKQAVTLVTAGSERNWFQSFWDYLICFPNHQIVFNRLNEIPAHKRQSNCLVYLGTNEQAFIREFSKFGHIAKSIAGPRHETTQARLWGVA